MTSTLSVNDKEIDAFKQLASATDEFEQYRSPHASRIAQLADEIAQRFLLASRRLDRTVAAGLHALPAPVLLLLAGHDRIIDNERTRELLGRLPPGRLRTRIYEQATHSIQLEETERMVRDVTGFLQEIPC